MPLETHGYKGSLGRRIVDEFLRVLLRKELGIHTMQLPELRHLKKRHGSASTERDKCLKALDPKCPAGTPLLEHPVLRRYLRLYQQVGGRFETPSNIADVKAELSKRIKELEAKDPSLQQFFSQHLIHFIGYVIAEDELAELEKRLLAEAPVEEVPKEVGSVVYDEFTKDVPAKEAYAPAQDAVVVVPPVEIKKKPAGEFASLRDIFFDGPDPEELKFKDAKKS